MQQIGGLISLLTNSVLLLNVTFFGNHTLSSQSNITLLSFMAFKII